MNKIQRPNMKSLPAEELCALIWTCGGGRNAAHELAIRLAKAQAEIESLKAQLFAPYMWICIACGSVLCAGNDLDKNQHNKCSKCSVPYGRMTHKELSDDQTKRAEIAEAQLAECRDKALEEAAQICDYLPVDEERCRILNLPSQAWEEGMEACIKAIRSLKGVNHDPT